MKNKTLLVTAVLLGALAVFMINSRIGDLEEKASPPTTSFYRALVDVPPGTVLDGAVAAGQILPVTTVPRSFALAYPDAVDSTAYETWKGQTIARPIRAGEFLRFEDLAPFTSREFSALFPRGQIAISIGVSAETCTGYLIAPHDRVDVYLVRSLMDGSAPGGREIEAIVVGSDLEVFAVDNFVQDTPQKNLRYRGSPYSTVTLTGPPEKVEALLKARAEGTLTLALRGTGGG